MTLPTLGTCSLRDRVLDAAETFAGSEGAAHLTLDAVAQAAGVSKGGLLYHFPSKDALLAALIERHVSRIDASCCRLRPTMPGGDDAAELKAWVVSMLETNAARRDTGAALFAAAANNPALLDCVRERYGERVQNAARTSGNFPLAAVILLAVDGLVLSEIWHMSPFTEQQRAAIVQQLLDLVDEAFGPGLAPEKKE